MHTDTHAQGHRRTHMLRRREPAMKATQLTRMAIISTKDVHQATLLWSWGVDR